VNILGHPSGRLIGKREAYSFDLEKVCKIAKDNHVALEIDSSPARLDLRSTHVRTAVEIGTKLVINSDAHAMNHFDFLKLGVFTARRGWAQKKHIVNTLPLAKFKSFFK